MAKETDDHVGFLEPQSKQTWCANETSSNDLLQCVSDGSWTIYIKMTHTLFPGRDLSRSKIWADCSFVAAIIYTRVTGKIALFVVCV